MMEDILVKLVCFIIITTNLTFDRWEEIFKDAMLTGAMVDRLAYKAHILDLSRMVRFSLDKYKRELGFKNNNISSNCLGKKPTAYGYKWRYLDE